MKVYCISIPRIATTEAGAIYDTTWNIHHARLFQHLLDDLQESLQEPFALEFYTFENTVYVCFAADQQMANMLKNGIYAFIGDAEINEIPDYAEYVTPNTKMVSVELSLKKPDIFPLQDCREYAWDSLAPIVQPLSSLGTQDRAILQLSVCPIKDSSWQQLDLWSSRAAERFARQFRAKTYLKKELELNTQKKIKEKCALRLYRVNYRLAVLTEDPHQKGTEEYRKTMGRLVHHVQSITNGVKVFNSIDENQLVVSKPRAGTQGLEKFRRRYLGGGFRLSTFELTSVWHPPKLGTLPNTSMVVAKKGTPPKNLPMKIGDPQISFFAHTNYRDMVVPFGIKRFDRRRHLYLLGKSGSGKSCMLQLLVKNDIDHGFGTAVLDPHGDLVDDILKLIPKHRVKDVVLFDPSDLQFPPSFNPMNAIRPELKTRVTIGFIDIFRRVFGTDWSDRMDHVIRYAMLALLNIPGASILSFRKLLSDDEFRSAVLKRVDDESIRRFWENEFVARRAEFEGGTISPLLNRIDQLLATDMIRNILGQPLNLFNFREFMDTRKIVLMKVSKGILGSENASLLGSLVIAKIYEAAMSRADIPVESRQDFYFYIDEFQNFATDSFGEILSESRKYRLSLTFANQFLGQLPTAIRDTVFGNVGNLITFRTGGEDGGTLAREMQPRFESEDIVNLGLREFYIKMAVDGEVQEAFSGRTLDVKYPLESEHFAKDCIAHSRSKYALPLAQAVETLNVSEVNGLEKTPRKVVL